MTYCFSDWTQLWSFARTGESAVSTSSRPIYASAFGQPTMSAVEARERPLWSELKGCFGSISDSRERPNPRRKALAAQLILVGNAQYRWYELKP